MVKGNTGPEKKTIEKARQDKREAGEFVREEIEHIRQGKHGVRSPEQAIATRLSKARRAVVELPPPKKDTASEATRKRAERDLESGRRQAGKPTSAKRSRVREEVLKRESRSAATAAKLSQHAKKAAAARRRRGRARAPGPRNRAAPEENKRQHRVEPGGYGNEAIQPGISRW